MSRYGMIIDVDKCTGCYSCFLACKDEYFGNDYPPYSSGQPPLGQFWMRLREVERGTCPKVKLSYIPIPCMQCDDAPCVAASSNGAVYRRPDGIVIIDSERAIGQREIVSSCPYNAIFYDEERSIPQKCTFCAHLLDRGWREPRCVEACPTEALLFGDLTDPESEISKAKSSRATETLYPEHGLKSGVSYTGLPKRFIAGEVVLEDRQEESAVGVSVTLFEQEKRLTEKTDDFGDFEFEGLEPDREYLIEIEYEGYAPKKIRVKTEKDLNLGEIFLKPA